MQNNTRSMTNAHYYAIHKQCLFVKKFFNKKKNDKPISENLEEKKSSKRCFAMIEIRILNA